MRDKGKPWPPRHRNVLRETMQSLEELIQDVDDDIPWLEVPATPPTEDDQAEEEPLHNITDAELNNTLFDDNGPVAATEHKPQPPEAPETAPDTQAAAGESEATETASATRAPDSSMFDWDDSGGSFPSDTPASEPEVIDDSGSRAAPGETIDWVDADDSSPQQPGPAATDVAVEDDEDDVPILENVSAVRTQNTPPPDTSATPGGKEVEAEDDEPILESVSVVRSGSAAGRDASAALGRVLVETHEVPEPEFPPEELLKQVIDFINVRLDLLANRMLDKDTAYELRENLRELLAAWNRDNNDKS
jgi:hypothetical protein